MCKICKKCGTADRYANGRCKACHKARSARWKAENPDKAKATDSAYYLANRKTVAYANKKAAYSDRKNELRRTHYAENPDRERNRLAAYRAEHKDRIRASDTKYKKSNQIKCRIHENNRRARERAAGGKMSRNIVGALLKLQRGKCACGCGEPLGDDYHLDHRMPLALGGTNTDDNAQLLRSECNLKKGALDPVEFMQSRGFLL